MRRIQRFCCPSVRLINPSIDQEIYSTHFYTNAPKNPPQGPFARLPILLFSHKLIPQLEAPRFVCALRIESVDLIHPRWHDGAFSQSQFSAYPIAQPFHGLIVIGLARRHGKMRDALDHRHIVAARNVRFHFLRPAMSRIAVVIHSDRPRRSGLRKRRFPNLRPFRPRLEYDVGNPFDPFRVTEPRPAVGKGIRLVERRIAQGTSAILRRQVEHHA